MFTYLLTYLVVYVSSYSRERSSSLSVIVVSGVSVIHGEQDLYGHQVGIEFSLIDNLVLFELHNSQQQRRI